MHIKKVKINNEKVKAIPFEGAGDTRLARGHTLFDIAWSNIYLSAKKKSGKTSAVYKILQKCMSKQTTLIIFCATVHKDPAWKYIVKYYKQHGADVEVHTSLREDGVDQLNELVTELENTVDSDEEEEEEELPPKEILKQKGGAVMNAILAHNAPPPQEGEQEGGGKQRKPRKSKYIECEYIIVLDDISTELKSKSLVALLKKNRHFKAKIIMSSQYYLDLLPESRKQIDYFLLFRSQTEDKLKAIYKDADITVPYETFKEYYKDATSKKWGFLYVDCTNDLFRDGFDLKIEEKKNI